FGGGAHVGAEGGEVVGIFDGEFDVIKSVGVVLGDVWAQHDELVLVHGQGDGQVVAGVGDVFLEGGVAVVEGGNGGVEGVGQFGEFVVVGGGAVCFGVVELAGGGVADGVA